VVSWPLLVVGSLVLGLIEYSGAARWINSGLRPLTWVLGVPAAVGVTLIFGVLRKELAMVMLTTALGTTAIATVMTPQQMLVFTVFLVFYIPCVSTIAVMWKELGGKLTGLAAAYSMALALVLALGARAVLSFVL
jgi:ferrous iron transport protein B